jgi:hypothetical protein
LDSPALAAVAAQLLTLQGLTVQATTMPEGAGRRAGGLRWYRLGVGVADRSGDGTARVWARGRAALRLAAEGAELPVAVGLAREALEISEQPSPGLLGAQLALALAQGWAGDGTALASLDDARRTFDVVADGLDSDFAFPEWRMAVNTSLVAARLGEERLALRTWDEAASSLPRTAPRFATSLELHRALTMVRSGDREGGLGHAEYILGRLPPGEHRPFLRLRMAEITSPS